MRTARRTAFFASALPEPEPMALFFKMKHIFLLKLARIYGIIEKNVYGILFEEWKDNEEA